MSAVLRAVVFDLDGTAVPGNSKGMPSSALIHSVREARSLLRLCAATGRAWPLARPIIMALELDDPCIVSAGTVIVDPVTEKVLWQIVLPAKTVEEIAAVASEYSYRVAYAAGLTTEAGIRARDLVTAKDPNSIYILGIPSSGVADIMQALAHIKGITVSKAHSWELEDGIDLHITSHIATKEHAVHQLAKLLDIPAAAMAGVGDGHNDLHLFNAVGYKVAMGNAVPELKAEADEVIESLDDEGLAKYILDLC